MISDKALATRVALTGNHRAFTLLVERHQGAVRNYLRRLLVNDDATADDLAQETFLTAFQKMGSWRGTAKLSTWLHSIAYRKFLDHLRKQRRQLTMTNLPDPGQDNRQALDDEIMAKHLMGLLKPKDRAVMKGVRHQQRVRKLILTVTSMVGGIFGVAGVLMVSDGISQFVTSANLLPASVALVGVTIFMAWLFQDEVSAVG